MDIRKIRLSDETVFRLFEQALLEDKNTNPFVEWWQVQDFDKFVAQSDQSEIKQADQAWSPFTRYFAFVGGRIAGFVICFWEMNHPDCLKLGHIGYMVAPAFRRQGLATALVTLAKERYRERGISQVLIATDQDNQASRGLIEKLGRQLVSLEDIDYHGLKRQTARYALKTEEK